MIWSGGNTALERSALLRLLTSEIAGAVSDPAFASQFAGEVARGVEAYCSEVLPDQAVPSDFLTVLLSRALWGVGEGDAALNLAARPQGETPPEVLDHAALFRRLTPAAWTVFQSRLVRPSRWLTEGEHLVWVLDLGRMRWERGSCVEMSFLRALKAVLEGIAEVWDAGGGRGALGLKGAAGAARKVLGEKAPAAKVSRFAVEIRAFCEGLLINLRHRRGWAEVPRLLDLDPATVAPSRKESRRR